MSNVSLGKNAFLNMLKQACSIIFPFVSFIYCSRVLGAQQLGIYSFGQSIISYLLLVSNLGIPNYSIREGAIIRSQKGKLRVFINELFTINCLSMMISYGLLILGMILVPNSNVYKFIILIQSLQIILVTLGTDWINLIFEDYYYLTVRYIIIQIMCLLGLICFVKTPNDIYIYTFISVMANAGGNILNFFYLRKKDICINFVWDANIKKHIRPIFILFFNNIASVIYLNSDITMIGLLLDETQVGVYTVASRIYTMIKTLINALILVTVPRFSMYIATDRKEEYEKELQKVFDILMLMIVPTAIGMFIKADEIIILIAGEDYLSGVNVIRILSLAILFAVLACYMSYSILLPNKKDMVFMLATSIAAFSNIAFNLFMIPMLKIDGAAYTTLVAEIIVFLISYKYVKKMGFILMGEKRSILICVIGGVAISFVCLLIDRIICNQIINLFVSILTSALVYISILFLLKHKVVRYFFESKKGI